MRVTWRGVELRLLLPILVMVPLGFVITNIAIQGQLDPGPLGLAIGYVSMFLAAHVFLVLSGHRGDQLILPAVGAMGGIGLIMLNRLPQELAGTSAFGIELGMAATQLLWFAIGLVVMLAIAIGLRDDGILRHYKYTWAAIGIVLLAGYLPHRL